MTNVEAAKLFQYQHLPEHLRLVSLQFYEVAMFIIATVPEGMYRDNALKSLWDAKNWAVAEVAQR